jgi:hypothetical protein
MLKVKRCLNQIIKVFGNKKTQGSQQDGQISAKVTCASGK